MSKERDRQFPNGSHLEVSALGLMKSCLGAGSVPLAPPDVTR